MQTQTAQFAVVTKNAEVQKVGRSSLYQNKSQYDGRKTTWFDDTKLIRK